MAAAQQTTPILVKPAGAEAPRDLRLPGSNCCAYAMLPFRCVFTFVMVLVNWPLMVVVAVLRAIYLRCCCGKPSKILRYGAGGVGDGHDKKNGNHMPDAVSTSPQRAAAIAACLQARLAPC